jgi:hypothetical protein
LLSLLLVDLPLLLPPLLDLHRRLFFFLLLLRFLSLPCLLLRLSALLLLLCFLLLLRSLRLEPLRFLWPDFGRLLRRRLLQLRLESFGLLAPLALLLRLVLLLQELPLSEPLLPE